MIFLFWNLRGKRLEEQVAALAEDHDADVLLLVENEIPVVDLLGAINRNATSPYMLDNQELNEKVSLLSRLPEGRIIPLADDPILGVSVRAIVPVVGNEIILAVAHLPSKLYAKEMDQMVCCQQTALLVDEAEKSRGHYRSVVVGDLNLNPFESGAVAASALHGVMSRRIAEGQTRSLKGKAHRFFYNPMWARFGDHTLGPPGTYYYRSAEEVCYFWHTFDQVLVRPDLLKCFHDEELKVLTKAGAMDLQTEATIPDVSGASDHFPLVFQLHLELL
ncbi:MAG TPA: endonuclease/exonuclease/phosphatase family protein [Candidatus Acidoferrum sp.]|nr:endonuclease/exonuclease/phosphatase family protein [Candidatus Acidoferrum sp.]